MLSVVTDSGINVYPHDGEDEGIQNNEGHDDGVEILVLDNLDAELADGAVCTNLRIRLQFVAFQLNLDPLFLKMRQFEITVDFFLLLVEGIYHYLDEQIGNEKGAENHVNDENVLVHQIFFSFWFQTNAYRIYCIIHKLDPSLSSTHSK